jgi:ryanodine receptor 2
MNTTMNKRAQMFYNTIQAPVLQEHLSPYQVVNTELQRLETSYRDSLAKCGQNLPNNINEDYSRGKVRDFLDMAKRATQDTSELENRIIATLNDCLQREGNSNEARKDLGVALQALRSFVRKQMFYEPQAENSDDEMASKRAKAEKTTLLEHITRSNDDDVYEYCDAFYKEIIRESRIVVRQHIGHYLIRLCDKISDNFNLTELYDANTDNVYLPSPIETSDIVLPDRLMLLAEEMAENVHEIWAATRLEQGWSYGTERNDALKQHPCLVPYDQLPESEKEYDRNTSIETLKFIIAKGWRIVK